MQVQVLSVAPIYDLRSFGFFFVCINKKEAKASYLFNLLAAPSSMINVKSGCVLKIEAGKEVVGSSSTNPLIAVALLSPQAIKTTRLASIIFLIPIVTACVGTSSKMPSKNKRALSLRVDSSNSI